MKTSKVIINSLAMTLLAVGFSACTSTTVKEGSAVVDTKPPAATEKAEEKKPAGFLATDFKPLDDWMNERYRIEYRAQPPEKIFSQVPLDDIHYNTSNLPTDAPVFNFDSESVSRRELLKAIADHWDLKMEYSIGEDGTPSAVNVSG